MMMNESLQHALVIVNPHSRGGQNDALKEAVRTLEKSGTEVSVCESENESHLNSLVREYQRENGVIIIAGGDGTLSSALEAAYSCDRTLAILPMGTANDFARSIGIPLDLVEAAQVILNGKRECVNLGKVNDKYFINVAHVGLGVDVTHQLTSEKKDHLGVFAYLGAFMKAIKLNRSFNVRIKADNEDMSVRAIHLAVGNGRFYGGGNVVDKESTVLDGQLNLFCIKAQHRWQLLLLGRSLRKGTYRNKDRILSKKAQKFSIHTSTPREIEADGESKTKTPADVEVIAKAIKVIVGDVPMPEKEEGPRK